MKRYEFLSALGVSAGTVIFAPFLTSCSKSSMTATNNPPGGGGAVDFTVDLTLPANSALMTKGGSLVHSNIIVAFTSAGAYVAVSNACTHQGYALGFSSDDKFHCQNPAAGHGSVFNSNGAVSNGPAVSPLTVYQTTLTGTSLRVFA